MNELTTNLDQAFERLHQGESLATILPDYPAQADTLEALLRPASMLDLLRPAPLPGPSDLAADRARFLAELDQLVVPAVSTGPLMRLKEWITHPPLHRWIQTYIFQEQRCMNTLLIKATLVLTLIFGAAGGAAVASAHSLPDSPLYSVKIGLEEARLLLTTDPAQQAYQRQARVQERIAEIAQMGQQGLPIGEAEQARLQLQLQECLQQVAGLPEPAMVQQLAQLQQMLQLQQQALEQVGKDQPGVQATLQMMLQAGQAAAVGQVEPGAFRQHYGHDRPIEAPAPGSGPASPACCTPQPTGDAHQYGPRPTQPGPGQPGGNPADQNTPQPTGDAHQYGPQPTQPGPGQPGGNPAGQNTPQPTGDAYQYGPQPTQPGPGQPGGNPADQNTPQPTGDAYQHGPQSTPGQAGNGSGSSSGSDNSGGTGGSDNSGGSNAPDNSGDSGNSDSSGGSGDSGGSDSSGDSDNSDNSGDSGNSDSSGGSGDSGGPDSSGNSDNSDNSGDSGSSGNSGGSGGSGSSK